MQIHSCIKLSKMNNDRHCNFKIRTNLALYVTKISVSLTKRWNIFSLVILIILFGGTKCIKSGSWFLPFPRRVFKALHRAHLCVLIELALCWRKSVAMCLEWINLLSLAACMLWIMIPMHKVKYCLDATKLLLYYLFCYPPYSVNNNKE